MDDALIEFIDYPDISLNITEYNPEFKILNDRSVKSSSGVWKHFGTIQHNDAIDRKHVYCLLCFYDQKMKKYQRTTSTGNLSKHLRKQHHISLHHMFRVKKDADNSIHVLKKEDEFEEDLDKSNENLTDGSDEFIINDLNEILITEVAKRPILYKIQTNQQEKGIKMALRRQQWMEIYEILNRMIPLEKIPKIWKNIRDRYHKVKRINNARGLESRPKYRYYDLLQFLDTGEEPKLFETNKNHQIIQIVNEDNGDEYLITGDHDHYISSEAIDAPTEHTLENVDYETKPKKRPARAKKRKAIKQDYEILTEPANKDKRSDLIDVVVPSNIIEESYANANEIYTPYEEELVTEETNNHEQVVNDIINSEQVEMLVDGTSFSESANTASTSDKKLDEFDMFGTFVSEVMRNMTKSRLRTFQMKVLELISEAENQ